MSYVLRLSKWSVVARPLAFRPRICPGCLCGRAFRLLFLRRLHVFRKSDSVAVSSFLVALRLCAPLGRFACAFVVVCAPEKWRWFVLEGDALAWYAGPEHATSRANTFHATSFSHPINLHFSNLASHTDTLLLVDTVVALSPRSASPRLVCPGRGAGPMGGGVQPRAASQGPQVNAWAWG